MSDQFQFPNRTVGIVEGLQVRLAASLSGFVFWKISRISIDTRPIDKFILSIDIEGHCVRVRYCKIDTVGQVSCSGDVSTMKSPYCFPSISFRLGSVVYILDNTGVLAMLMSCPQA